VTIFACVKGGSTAEEEVVDFVNSANFRQARFMQMLGVMELRRKSLGESCSDGSCLRESSLSIFPNKFERLASPAKSLQNRGGDRAC